MPGNPKECRLRARRCAELAASAKDLKLKHVFSDLAKSWTTLAVQLEAAMALRDELEEES
jgi:hypothetical protein